MDEIKYNIENLDIAFDDFCLQVCKILTFLGLNKEGSEKNLISDKTLLYLDNSDVKMLAYNVAELVEKFASFYKNLTLGRFERPVAYVFTAWADELILQVLKGSAIEWKSGEIESIIFSSREAGEKIFEQINNIIYEAEKTPLAIIYMKLISFGYKGYLYDRSNKEDLQHLSKLYNELLNLSGNLHKKINDEFYNSELKYKLKNKKKTVDILAYILLSLMLLSVIISINQLNNNWIVLDKNLEGRIKIYIYNK